MPTHLLAQPFNRVVWAIGLLFAGASLVLGALAIDRDYKATERRYLNHALDQSNALQTYAAVVFRQSDLSLQGIARDLIQHSTGGSPHDEFVRATLRNSLRFDPVSEYLFVALGDKLWIIGNNDQYTVDAELRQRLSKLLAREPKAASAFEAITLPARSRWITLMRTAPLADGRVLQLGALVRADRFDEFNNTASDARNHFDALISADEILLWQGGQPMPSGLRLPHHETRQTRKLTLRGGDDILIAYQRPAGFPLLAVSGFHQRDYLADWRKRVVSDVLFFSTCALLALITTGWIARRIKTVSDSERYYHQLFHSVIDGLLLVRGAHIVAANAQAAVIFGADDPSALVGLPALTLSPPLQPDGNHSLHRIERYRVATQAGAKPTFTWRHLRLDNGKPVDCNVQLSLIELNGKRHILVVVRDISERQRMEEALQQSRQQLLEVQRIAGIGVWSMRLESGRCEWSEEVFRILGHDPAFNEASETLFLESVYPPDRYLFPPWHQRLLAGEHMSLEFRVLRANGELREVAMEAESIGDARDGARIAGAIFDITERKRIERRLMNSERQYRQLVELMPEAILIQRRGHIVYANPAAGALFRQRFSGDLVGRTLFDLISPESHATVVEKFTRIVSREDFSKGFERYLLLRLDGESFHAEMAADTLFFDGTECVQVVLRDIDARERMQRALALSNARLQALSAQMIEMLENDRRQLARELHDDVGQLLTFLQLGCGRLQQRLADAEYGQRLATLHTCAGEALGKVRDLSRMLRPAQLDAQGLTAAIEWQLQHYLQGGAILYRAQLPELQPRPDGTIEITLFRIFQEALTNVIRHSGASQVSVTLNRGDGKISLSIVDDGMGFDVEAKQEAGGGLGLISMSERAKLVGGHLLVHSVPGIGTELTVTLPDLEILELQKETETHS